MGLSESRAKISKTMNELLALWSATKVSWSDINSERFEETFLRPLEMDVRSTAVAMDQMASLLSQIRRECE
jgi:hypothetical protein